MEKMTKEEFEELCRQPREIVIFVGPQLSKAIDEAARKYWNDLYGKVGLNVELKDNAQ